MSLSTQLTRLAQNVGALNADTNAIFEALRAKGVNVPANAQLSDVADMIEEIEVPTIVNIGGRDYPYVQIGNQLWIAENLDWKFSGCGIGNHTMTTSSSEACYYNDDEATYGVNGNKYGLLYNWCAINYIEQNKSTMLPDGWRVPSINDYVVLTSFVGNDASSLKATTWRGAFPGTDTYGMTLYPSGGYYGVFADLNDFCNLWTTSGNGSDAYYTMLGYDSNNIRYNSQTSKQNYMSLRIVKDVT